MTASVLENPSYSALTFALFEDTGWYQVDYEWAYPLNWGKNAGCNLFLDKCISSEGEQFDFYCTEEPGHKDYTQCSHNALMKGFCGISTKMNNIPNTYQYWGSANKGGVDEYADYCPRVYAYAEGDCRLGKSMDTRFSHGPSSRCVEMLNQEGEQSTG